VRVCDEDVRVGDCGDAVDQVEGADDDEQDGRVQDQAIAAAFPRCAAERRSPAAFSYSSPHPAPVRHRLTVTKHRTAQ
jgi:hypothetical protein